MLIVMIIMIMIAVVVILTIVMSVTSRFAPLGEFTKMDTFASRPPRGPQSGDPVRAGRARPRGSQHFVYMSVYV